MRLKPIIIGALTALLSLSVSSSGWAQAKKDTKKEAKKDPKKDGKDAKKEEEKPSNLTKKPIALVPEGMTWGMTREVLEKLVDKFIDDEFRPKYKKAGKSAPQIKNLDVEAANQKASFRRNFIDLVPGPTGLDNGPLAVEFTKGNGEALMPHHRGPGVKIWFFFIGGRLWKTLEEVSLVPGGLYGADVSDAVKKILDSVGGSPPNKIDADPEKGKYYDVFEWNDEKTHMRMWDRSGVFVLVREDKATLANLAALRKNVGKSTDVIDPSVSKIMRDNEAPPPPKKEEPKKDDRSEERRVGK